MDQSESPRNVRPGVRKKNQSSATPGPAIPLANLMDNQEEEDMVVKMENIEEWRDNVNNELDIVAHSSSSEDYRAYGD